MIELASTRLFAGLGKDEAGAILAAAAKRSYRASETIIRADVPAGHFVVVTRGSVDFYIISTRGHRVLIRRFVPGNAFGVAAFLSEPMGYLGTAEAVNDVEVLAWEHRRVRQLSRMYPQWPENAFRIALRYLAEYAERHLRLVADTAQERLAHALTTVASHAGHVIPTGVEVNVKNEDLASLADVSFFTASRFLGEWTRLGAVEKKRGKVLIRCPEKLLADETCLSRTRPSVCRNDRMANRGRHG
jgi:CRP-like cAMP-binding protein